MEIVSIAVAILAHHYDTTRGTDHSCGTDRR
jgi:hypothetical protein